MTKVFVEQPLAFLGSATGLLNIFASQNSSRDEAFVLGHHIITMYKLNWQLNQLLQTKFSTWATSWITASQQDTFEHQKFQLGVFICHVLAALTISSGIYVQMLVFFRLVFSLLQKCALKRSSELTVEK